MSKYQKPEIIGFTEIYFVINLWASTNSHKYHDTLVN